MPVQPLGYRKWPFVRTGMSPLCKISQCATVCAYTEVESNVMERASESLSSEMDMDGCGLLPWPWLYALSLPDLCCDPHTVLQRYLLKLSVFSPSGAYKGSDFFANRLGLLHRHTHTRRRTQKHTKSLLVLPKA